MIDIIIPAYNAHSTIKKTLASIALQNNKDDIKVCIVDDCSKEDYSSIVDLFKGKINIKEIRLDKNSGPGVARQYGIDNTNSEYIMFLDADDLLYDSYTITDFINMVKRRKLDMVYGIIIDEENDRESYIYYNHQGCLHGKLYKREFIIKHDIKFLDSYYHEDNAFNRLVLLHKPKMIYLDKYSYVYKNNALSITNQKNIRFDNLDIFINNMIKDVEIAINHKCDKKEIGCLLVHSLMYIFKVYMNNYEKKDKDVILKWAKPLVMYYNKYSSEVSQSVVIDIYLGFGLQNFKVTFNDFMKLLNEYEGD